MEETNGERPCILVVDDSAFMRKRVLKTLAEADYTLVEATNGLCALEEIDKRHFDCILTDLLMPELDGFGLLEEIQKRHVLTPVVVLTADIQKATRERCEVLGAVRLLQKPARPEELRSVLAGIIGGRN